MLITLRRANAMAPPPPPVGMERVTSMVILGVTISSNLRATTHVTEVLGACSSSLHALRVLRSHGLPPTALHEVTRATTVARLLYAAPAWWGYASAADRSRLERLLQRMRMMGFLPPRSPGVGEMVGVAEARLLQAVTRCEHHLLRGLFPPKLQRRHNLRPRPHDFELPAKDTKNFIPRVLFKRSTKVPSD